MAYNYTKKLTVQTINKSMRVAEVADLLRKICGDYKDRANTDERLQQMMNQLDDYYARITQALNRRKAQGSLKELDKERLARAHSLLRYSEAYSCSGDDAILTHWQAIEVDMVAYLRLIIGGNMKTRTSYTTALLYKASEPEMASHIAALPGLKGGFDALQSAHDAFAAQSIVLDKMKLEAKGETASEVKVLIIDLVNDELLVHLRAQCNINAEPCGEFLQMVGNNIASYNALVRARCRKKTTSSNEVLAEQQDDVA